MPNDTTPTTPNETEGGASVQPATLETLVAELAAQIETLTYRIEILTISVQERDEKEDERRASAAAAVAAARAADAAFAEAASLNDGNSDSKPAARVFAPHLRSRF